MGNPFWSYKKMMIDFIININNEFYENDKKYDITEVKKKQ